jgi:hypothetical protein
VTLVQSRTDHGSLGRVNGTFRLVDWSLVPLGALLGGVLAEVIGIRSTLLVASAIAIAQLVLVFASPARHVRDAGDAPAGLAARTPEPVSAG